VWCLVRHIGRGSVACSSRGLVLSSLSPPHTPTTATTTATTCRYIELLERDVIKFGLSTREYVLLNEKSAG